jgi:hypothetical protein
MRITPATNSINSANTTKERNADYSINTSLKPVNNSRLLIDFKVVTKIDERQCLMGVNKKFAELSSKITPRGEDFPVRVPMARHAAC